GRLTPRGERAAGGAGAPRPPAGRSGGPSFRRPSLSRVATSERPGPRSGRETAPAHSPPMGTTRRVLPGQREQLPSGLRRRTALATETSNAGGSTGQRDQHLCRAVADRDGVGQQRQHAFPGRKRDRIPARTFPIARLDDQAQPNRPAPPESWNRVPLLVACRPPPAPPPP